MPAHRGRGFAAVPPCAQRQGGDGPLSRHRVRPAVSRPLDAGGPVVAEEVSPHHAELSGDDPRGVAQARPRAAGGDGLLDGRRDRAEGRGGVSGRACGNRRAGKLGLRAGALQRAAASSGDPRRRTGRELHLRPQRADQSGDEPARELVVLQPVGAGRLPGRRPFLQQRLGRPRGHQAHRHQPLQGRAAHRRIRLLVHAGDDREGRGEHSGFAHDHHEGHGAFPDDRELPGFPAVSACRRWITWRGKSPLAPLSPSSPLPACGERSTAEA